jgi:hypothetical protein
MGIYEFAMHTESDLTVRDYKSVEPPIAIKGQPPVNRRVGP